MRKLLSAATLFALAAALAPARDLEIYFIDVEGGQATLFVSRSGESMLVDTGFPGFNNRDANRIAAAAKAAGVKRIDYLVITHYHQDHVGGVPQLAARLPIRNFVDHGPSVETGKDQEWLYKAYEEFRSKGNHVLVKPGDTIPVKDLDVRVVASAGAELAEPLPGAGQPGPDCAAFRKQADDAGENAQSIGLLISDGPFRMADLGDLTWNKEAGLVCPVNKLGAVDLFLTSHHGLASSNSPQLVHALHPRVAVMNNGARKGGAAETLRVVRASPGLEDLWQLHYSVLASKSDNSPDTFIANIDEACQGKWLRVTVLKDGSFTVYNSRNRYEKTYAR